MYECTLEAAYFYTIFFEFKICNKFEKKFYVKEKQCKFFIAAIYSSLSV